VESTLPLFGSKLLVFKSTCSLVWCVDEMVRLDEVSHADGNCMATVRSLVTALDVTGGGDFGERHNVTRFTNFSGGGKN
jgi:hypothetical protein